MGEAVGVGGDLGNLVDKLEIEMGVFKPDWGSITLAEVASQYDGKFLDMGTGSGYITIALYLKDKEGDAADVSSRALRCAGENFMNFGVFPKTIKTNLYSGTDSKYDTIIYNPPKGANETEHIRMLKSMAMRFLPSFVIELSERIYQRVDMVRRRKELLGFVKESREHLNENGVLLMNLLPSDANWLRYVDGYTVTEKATNGRRTVAEIKYAA